MRAPVFLLFSLMILLFICPANADTGTDSEILADEDITQVVEVLIDAGILKGYPDGTFRGDDFVTRYEMGAVLTRFYSAMLGEMNDRDIEVIDFVDIRREISGNLDMSGIPENHWAHEEIARLEHMGLVAGMPDGSFGGSSLTTRYQFAVLLIRTVVMLDFAIWEAIPGYYGGLRQSGTFASGSLTDVPPDHWALRDIRRLYISGDDLGVAPEEFMGDREVTRAEMAVVISRLIDRFIDELELAIENRRE